MNIHDCIQYSPTWWELRAGKPTASEFKRILSPIKVQPSSQQDGYIAELIGDRMMQLPPFFSENGRPQTPAMLHGKETEAEARSWFSFHTALDVRQVGFITTDDGSLGASPDGLIFVDGKPVAGLELKCPQPKQHLKNLIEFRRTGQMPISYRCQTHGGLIVGEGVLKTWWFVSFCPNLDPIAVEHGPDDFTTALKEEVERFRSKYEAAAKSLIPQEDHAAIAGWRALLTEDLTLASLNANLPTLVGLEPEVKRACWTAIQAFAQRTGLVFNPEKKEFQRGG